MNIYAIDFVGHYPVGATAVVAAESEEGALILFARQLAIEEPSLSVKGATIEKLDFSAQKCHILSNGNY